MLKRRGIFVFYDAQGIVDEYIEVLLNSLKGVLNNLIIVVNGKISAPSFSKLEKYADEIFIRKNEGYDAGAYKDVFLKFCKFDDWNQWDEVVMFNDTFYGPFYSWNEIFDKMSKEVVDFWGLSCHPGREGKMSDGSDMPEHIQGYFIVVRKNMVLSPKFMNFWSEMKYPQTYKEAIENYEIKFTAFFKKHNFRYTSWLNLQDKTGEYSVVGKNPYMLFPYEVIRKCRFPIVKRRVFAITNFTQAKDVWEYIELKTNYNIDIIRKHLMRLSENDLIKPFSSATIEKFVKKYKKIYVFGHGKYGCELEKYFRYRGWRVEKFVVTSPKYINEVSYKQFEMSTDSGLIVALGTKAYKEVEQMIMNDYGGANILLPLV